MSVEALAGLITFLVLVGGLGWKLNAELSSIRLMIERLVVQSESRFAQIDKIEKRVDNLENKLLMRSTEAFKKLD